MSGVVLSVVIATRNEEPNIARCIDAFADFRNCIEVIVVDNASEDNTKKIAIEHNAVILEKGPERCAQRNFGWQNAAAPWVLILDADMIMPEATIRTILKAISCEDPLSPVAYWIREVRSGNGFRVKARNFERSFYDGTTIDALRLFRRDILEKTGGYDENLLPGGEDWDLDIRIKSLGMPLAVIDAYLVHNEMQLSIGKMLEKKAYYSKGLALYKAKWPNNKAVEMQFSIWYRFIGVFVEHGKWKRILRHPILFAAVIGERIAVGAVYLAEILKRRSE